MRKLVVVSIVLSVLAIGAAFYVLFDKEPTTEQKTEQEAPKAVLTGQTFALTYYPLNDSISISTASHLKQIVLTSSDPPNI